LGLSSPSPRDIDLILDRNAWLERGLMNGVDRVFCAG
jgi:hypothetical protein